MIIRIKGDDVVDLMTNFVVLLVGIKYRNMDIW
jgi:hypothetical protein